MDRDRRALGVALLAVLAAGIPARATATEAVAPPAWQAIAPGAERATLGSDPPVRLYRFDLTRFRAEVVVGAGRPPAPETAGAQVASGHAVAAVNGGFFDEHVAPLGLRIAGGQVRAALRAHADWGVLLLTADRARIIHTRDYQASPEVRGAIQVGPRLLVGGAPLTRKPQRARRTAVALDRDGRTLTLVVADDPIDAGELAARLAAAGFDAALMLDGGPSTQLALDLGGVRVDLPGGYPVPDLLAIVSATRR